MIREIENKRKETEDLAAANMEITQRAADYDQIFVAMKQATGGTTLQDVVDKFEAQISSHANLEKEKSKAEARLGMAKALKEAALKALNDLKASGIGGIELSRDVYAALENDILQAKAQLKANKAAYEGLDQILASVRQGASSLVQRLAPFEVRYDIYIYMCVCACYILSSYRSIQEASVSITYGYIYIYIYGCTEIYVPR